MLKEITLGAAVAAMFGSAAPADVVVTFRDGAPKDRFEITNTGDCPVPAVSVLIDLATSPSGLIFDVTGEGVGVEVFQPFEVVSGGDFIGGASSLTDGDQRLQLDLLGLPAGQTVAFTTDLDDTLGGQEITVSGSEIAGARVILGDALAVAEGVFDDQGRAVVPQAGCLS